MCNNTKHHRILKGILYSRINLDAQKLRLSYTVRRAFLYYPISTNLEIGQHGKVLGDNKIMYLGNPYHLDHTGLLAFILAKPWWEEALCFYLAVIALAALAVYFVCHQQLLNFNKKYSTLQRQVKVLATETNEAIERLRQCETTLLENNQIKNQVLTMVLHDIRSPVRSISMISRYLADKRSSISESSFNGTLQQLKLGSSSLETFIEKFFPWADSQRDNFKVQLRFFPLDAFLLEVTHLYRDISQLNENKITILPTCLICFSDYQLLACVIRNLVDNANKYTFHGLITLSASKENNELIINVSDTGNGLTLIQIEDFLTEHNKKTMCGTGSTLILSMLKKIDGKLQIQSQPGKGSTFSIRLMNFQPS